MEKLIYEHEGQQTWVEARLLFVNGRSVGAAYELPHETWEEWQNRIADAVHTASGGNLALANRTAEALANIDEEEAAGYTHGKESHS